MAVSINTFMPPKTYQKIEPEKLRNVALSFSGGGFRAASYALGCLSFLEKLSYQNKAFIDLVRFVSSASGGTLTSMGYLASQRDGQKFSEFFKMMTEEYLFGEKLIERVFTVLADDTVWKRLHVKSRNLINAFAVVYDEWVFRGKTFGVFFKDSLPCIREVCFNTTEFKNGMLLRFQNKGICGNTFIKFKTAMVDKKVWQEIKLGDILACSSCFPVGFEPVIFPQDFAYPGLTRSELAAVTNMDDRYWNAVAGVKPDQNNLFSLMDGGIDDNQGIDSFLKAEARLQSENWFGYDLYIACDVSSNYTKGFYHAAAKKPKFFGRKSLKWYLRLTGGIFVLCILGIFSHTLYEPALALFGICLVLLWIARVIYLFLKKEEAKLQKTPATEKGMLFRHKAFFFNLGVGYLRQALVTRGVSAAELAGVVFMKKIRKLSYAGLFGMVSPIPAKLTPSMQKNGVEQKLKFMREFVLQNALYLISEKNTSQRETDLSAEPWTKRRLTIKVGDERFPARQFIAPSVGMMHVATLATEVETTLWYDNRHQKCFVPAAVVASGQFTTCYNLLKYALRFADVPGENVWKNFREELAGHLHQFKTDPYFMYNRDIAGSKVLFQVKLDDKYRTVAV